MNNIRLLVIGSNSFSGSHFVAEALRADHHVWGVSRSAELDPVFLPYRWLDQSKGVPLATCENFQFKGTSRN
jgi:dTDP-glucose 4,6-dehydratase